MTLMSKTRYNFQRAFTCFVAVLPATYSLHVGCEHVQDDDDGHNHGLISSIVSCFSGHHCSCACHSPERSSDDETPSREKPHDSDSCAVCPAVTDQSFIVHRMREQVLLRSGTASGGYLKS